MATVSRNLRLRTHGAQGGGRRVIVQDGRQACPVVVLVPKSRPPLRALLVRIHTFIEQRLGDTDLSPASIAATHHISIRYLYKLFATQGSTVAGLVRQRRLARCRRDLLDPALRNRPVCAIANRWGFSSASQFNRAFRAVYGVPPGKYRRMFGSEARRCPA